MDDGEDVKGKDVATDNDEMDANVNETDGTAVVNESGGQRGGEFARRDTHRGVRKVSL